MPLTKTIGLIGCGTIGSIVAKAIASDRLNARYQINAVFDLDEKYIERVTSQLSNHPPFMQLSEMLEHCDIILETASTAAAAEVIRAALPAGKNAIVISTGGLVEFAPNDELGLEILQRLNSGPGKLIIPSGAVGGIDALKALAVDGLDKVIHTIRKPPQGLGMQNTVAQGVFFGSAREAVKLYPKNVNVTATVSLAGLGFDKTQVKLISDPKTKNNIHELYAEGKSGILTCSTENLPDPGNPKTSRLAALSIISVLDGLD